MVPGPHSCICTSGQLWVASLHVWDSSGQQPPGQQALGGRTLSSLSDQGEDPRGQGLSWLLGQEAVGPGHSWARADTEGFYKQPNFCVCPSISP